MYMVLEMKITVKKKERKKEKKIFVSQTFHDKNLFTTFFPAFMKIHKAAESKDFSKI
jgi:hypothetical protein